MTDLSAADMLSVDEQLELEALLEYLREGREAAAAILRKLEGIPEEQLDLALKFCQALDAVRCKRLYRPESFEAFCQRECGFGRNYAYKLVAHLKVVKALAGLMCTIGTQFPLPENERQSRELARAGSTEAQLVIMKGLAAQGGEITAERIKAAVDEYLAAPAKERLRIAQAAGAEALLREQQGFARQGLRKAAQIWELWGRIGPEFEPFVERLETLIAEAAAAAQVDAPKLGSRKREKARAAA